MPVYPALKYFFICSIWVFNAYNATSREPVKQLHIAYPGIRIAAERDHAYSPLIFSGIQESFSLAYNQANKNASNYFMLHYTSGSISNKWENNMQVQTAGIQTYKFYHRKKNAQSGLHWGWSNNNEFNTRDIAEVKNFNHRNEYFTSFGPAMRYIRILPFFEGRFSLESLVHLQLLGFKIQSSFVTSLPHGFEDPDRSGLEAIWHSLEIFYPGNAFNFGFQPKLVYELKSGNKLGISYRYDYQKLIGSHTLEKSRGTWYFKIISNL